MSDLNNEINLIEITAPNLNVGNYGDELKEKFKNIDQNFKKIANYPFTKGNDGESAIYETINLDKFGLATPYYRHAIYSALLSLTNFKTEDKIGEYEPYWFLGNLKSGLGNLYVVKQNDKYISSLAYVYIDPRFKNIKNIDLDDAVKEQFANATDLSCVLYVTGSYIDKQTKILVPRFTAIQSFPTLYYDKDLSQFCWKMHNTETGLIAQGPQGKDGKDGRLSVTYAKKDESSPESNVYIITKIIVGNEIEDFNSQDDKKLYDNTPAIIIPDIDKPNKPTYYWISELKLDNDDDLKAICDDSNKIDLSGIAFNAKSLSDVLKNIPDVNLRGLFLPINNNDAHVIYAKNETLVIDSLEGAVNNPSNWDTNPQVVDPKLNINIPTNISEATITTKLEVGDISGDNITTSEYTVGVKGSIFVTDGSKFTNIDEESIYTDLLEATEEIISHKNITADETISSPNITADETISSPIFKTKDENVLINKEGIKVNTGIISANAISSSNITSNETISSPNITADETISSPIFKTKDENVLINKEGIKVNTGIISANAISSSNITSTGTISAAGFKTSDVNPSILMSNGTTTLPNAIKIKTGDGDKDFVTSQYENGQHIINLANTLSNISALGNFTTFKTSTNVVIDKLATPAAAGWNLMTNSTSTFSVSGYNIGSITFLNIDIKLAHYEYNAAQDLFYYFRGLCITDQPITDYVYIPYYDDSSPNIDNMLIISDLSNITYGEGGFIKPKNISYCTIYGMQAMNEGLNIMYNCNPGIEFALDENGYLYINRSAAPQQLRFVKSSTSRLLTLESTETIHLSFVYINNPDYEPTSQS